MSVNNLFSPNDFRIYANEINVNTLNDGKARYRLNLDPTSNPDPFIGGLIITAAETAAFDFIVPLTLANQSLGIGNPFSYDPNNHLSFASNIITCNRTGYYNISLQMAALSNLITPNNGIIFQVLLNGINIFSGPPAITAGSPFFSSMSLPFFAIFNIAAFCSSVSNVQLTQGDQITLKFFLGYDSCVIPLTTNLSITEL